MATLEPLEILQTTLTRPATALIELDSETAQSFVLGPGHRSYKHQFANIYFIRLQLLRVPVEARAMRRWKDVAGAPVLVPRVLEVTKSQLCIIIGTVYMDMPLKPNVLEDIGRDHSIPAPPPRVKFCSPDDAVMLEDESGRIQLVGAPLLRTPLVTGIIMAALGLETAAGSFEVVDVCFAGIAPQAVPAPLPAPNGAAASPRMEVDDGSAGEGEWVALISGLDFGGDEPADAQIQLLAEYLAGEAGGAEEQRAAAKISRLIVAGNSLASAENPIPIVGDVVFDRKNESTTFTPHATHALGAFLLDVARAMPVHILAGETDPSGALLPQQPFPRAMFGAVKDYENFACETNPTWLGLGTRALLVDSGQPLSDMFKYLPAPPATRLSVAASMLHWRHTAPTAPDTLWCYPYFTGDPFILHATPDLYVVGNQPEFQTKLVASEGDGEDGGGLRRCRIVLVPRFAQSGTLVLVNLGTLEVRTVEFAVQGDKREDMT